MVKINGLGMGDSVKMSWEAVRPWMPSGKVLGCAVLAIMGVRTLYYYLSSRRGKGLGQPGGGAGSVDQKGGSVLLTRRQQVDVAVMTTRDWDRV